MAASTPEPFRVRDCALISLATGQRAQNLREFSEGVQSVPPGSIYHHFWGRLLRPQFDEPEYSNDFASWAQWGLRDKVLAERLSMVIPTDYADLESLRQEIVDVVEERLDETEIVPWARADQQFHFLQSQIVVLNTQLDFTAPADIASAISYFSTGAIFYHFIDARKRTEGVSDDFSSWLEGFGEEYMPLIKRLRGVDPYFSSLQELKKIISALFLDFFGKAA